MSSTANLQLPLLSQAQAQKHVTVNEALSILDSVAQLTLESVTTVAPPVSPLEGQGYLVPAGATGGWAGQDGTVVIYANGGWVHVSPRAGWRAFVKDEGRQYVCDGWAWQPDAVALSWYGAGVAVRVIESVHTIVNGTSNQVSLSIPAYSTVLGVTARVASTVTGTLTGWRLGVAGSSARYGYGLGLSAASWGYGINCQPLNYWEDTPLVVTAENGVFSGGSVRLAVQLIRLGVPRM